MKLKSRFKGIDLSKRELSPAAHALFIQIVEPCRRIVLDKMKDLSNFEGEVAVGRNFTDNHAVWQTLRGTTEQEFIEQPIALITEALVNCAERDWWYLHEKEWSDKESVFESEGV